MWEIVLIHREYDVLFDVITPLGYYDDIHSYNIYEDNNSYCLVSKGSVYYVILGFFDSQKLEELKTVIKSVDGILLKQIHYTLDDGTTFDDYLKSIIK